MKILHLTLKKKWFDMILSGEKKEEYREIKPYWAKRLLWTIEESDDEREGFEQYDAVEFRNGYSKDAPTMLVECKGISVGIGNPAWGAPEHPVFIIKLGKILEIKNCPSV